MPEIEKYKNSLTIGNKLSRLVWNICCLVLVRPFAGPLFNYWRCFIHRLFGMKVGKGCAIHSSCKVWAPWNITLGDRVCLAPNCELYSADKIIIGDKVTISQGAYLCSASHDISHINKPLITSPIKIDSFAWVCAYAFIGMGVTIGEGAVVGARAAVFKDVEPWTVVGGNPAKVIKKRVIKE